MFVKNEVFQLLRHFRNAHTGRTRCLNAGLQSYYLANSFLSVSYGIFGTRDMIIAQRAIICIHHSRSYNDCDEHCNKKAKRKSIAQIRKTNLQTHLPNTNLNAILIDFSEYKTNENL